MQELNKVLEDWIDGKIRTVMSPLLNASVTHEDQIHKLEEDSHFAFCDIQRIETRLDRLEAFVFSIELQKYILKINKEQLNKTAGAVDPAQPASGFTLRIPLKRKNVLEVAIDHAIEHHDGLISDPHHCEGEKREFRSRRLTLRSIKEQLNKTAGAGIAVVTNDNFWDCDCENNYIHTKSTRLCPHCNAESDEQPDSHQSEVEALVYLKK